MDKHDRFVRWQSQSMAQMSVALALLSGLSFGGLALCFSQVQIDSFKPVGSDALVFLAGMSALLVASFSSVTATVTRLLDFRLTAQKVRREKSEAFVTYLGTDATGYGKATWRLLWLTAACLLIAIACISVVFADIYLGRLIRAVGL